MTIAAVAERLALTPAMVSLVEAGARDPKLSHVELYAAVVDHEVQVQPVDGQLSPDLRSLLEAFRAELPHLTELEREVWRMELDLRRRRRT